MKRFCSIALAIGLAATATAYLPASAQPPATTQHATLQMSAASRAQLIDTLIDAIANRYVFPEMAQNVARTLRARQAQGAYDKLADAQQLSEALTRDLQAVTGDRHLHVAYSTQPIPVATPGGQPAPGEILRRRAMMQANNFGIDKIAHLPFNIGYLELTGFASAHEAAVTLAAAMTVVAHTDALIIDLRNNGGGDAATVALLAGYFFDDRTRLNDFYYRAGHRIEERWSAQAVSGPRYGQHKPVYILTSKETFSAAEDFTYALKNLKRATVIGATTGGGANPGTDVRLTPHFAIFMPLGRSVSPITQANWEAVGVTPDIATPAGAALKTAELVILHKIASSETDPDTLARLQARMAEIGRRAPGLEPAP